MSDAVQWMTYAELAETTGIGVESARNLVRRKRWQRRPGNDGAARIAVPMEHLEKPRGGASAPSDGGINAPSAPPPDAPVSAPTNGGADALSAITILTQHIALLQEEIVDLRAKASERDMLTAQLGALQAVLEVEKRRAEELLDAEKRRASELQVMLEQTRQERDAERPKAAERDVFAVQIETLKVALEESRQERDRWAVQAHALAHAPVPHVPPVVERRRLFGWLRRAG